MPANFGGGSLDWLSPSACAVFGGVDSLLSFYLTAASSRSDILERG